MRDLPKVSLRIALQPHTGGGLEALPDSQYVSTMVHKNKGPVLVPVILRI